MPCPPSWGCSPGFCASTLSCPGPGTGGGTPTTSAGTAPSGYPPSRAPAAPSSGPRGPLWAKLCSGGTPRSSTRAPTGRTPAARAVPTHGAGTWRPCGPRRRARRCGGRPGRAGWGSGTIPPACWHLRPLRRLTFFEGETAAGTPHTVGVDWWGRVWDNDPTRQPPPPTPGPRGRGGTWPIRCMPSSPWSPTCGVPPCRSRGRSMPRPGGPTSSAVLTQGLTRTSYTRSSRKLAASLARLPPPCRLPDVGRHLPLRRPLRHPARPPWGGDQSRPPDHRAAGPESEINLQACFAATLAPPLAPSDHWRLSKWVGWVPPPARGQPELHTPPPTLLGLRPPTAAAMRGRGAPPGANARGAGQCHVFASALAHGRRVARGRGANLRDPPHGGSAASNARPGWGLRSASFLGAPLESQGGEGIWDAPAGGWASWSARAFPQILPPKGAPRNEAHALAETLWHSTRWCHVLKAWDGGRTPCMPKWRTVSPLSRPSTGFSKTTPHGTWHATGQPPSWWEGTSTLTLTTRCGRRRPSWRPS